MKRISILPIVVFVVIIAGLNGCKKLYDLPHNPGASCGCKVTEANVHLGQGLPAVDAPVLYKFSYDKSGRLVSIVGTGDNFSTNLDKYFRYDKNNRLSDMLLTFRNSKGVLIWIIYSYQYPKTIVKKSYNYTNNIITDKLPTAYSYIATNTLYLDDLGRIIKEYDNDYSYIKNSFQYDIHGNMILSNVIYDNTINIHTTDPVLQFMSEDYSINNRTYTNGYKNYSKAISFNNYGLPIKFTQEMNSSSNSYDYTLSFLSDSINVKYDCSQAAKVYGLIK